MPEKDVVQRMLLLLFYLLIMTMTTASDAHELPMSLFNTIQIPAGGPASAVHVLDITKFDTIIDRVPDWQSTVNSTWDHIADVTEQFGAWTMVVAVTISDSIPLAPTQPIAIVAGAVFGLPIGLLSVIIGQAMATVLAVFIGRYVIARRREWMQALDQAEESAASPQTKSKLARVLEEMTVGLNSEDWKTVFGTIFLARQSPVLPFSLGNYFIGASTEASILITLIATVFGCLPLNCLYVGAGAGGTAAVQAMQEDGTLAKGLEVVGVVATAAIVVFGVVVICKVCKEEENQENGERE